MVLSNSKQKELWEHIQNFLFDEPASTLPFSRKLQKENYWSKNYTLKAIEEYRKFIFLCCISPTGASPSDTVDKVWHLHLTYTQNYWVSFCKNTLHKDIHHHPSKGGDIENIKHIEWYNETLKLYEEAFGYKAPLSIWPLHNSNINVPIYDKSFFNKTILLFIAATIVLVVTSNLFRLKGETFLIYYALFCLAGLLVSFLLAKHKGETLEKILNENYPQSFTTFQATEFMYGPHKSYQTALIDLLKRGIIDTVGNDYKLNSYQENKAQTDDNPLLEILTEKNSVGQIFTYLEGMQFINNDAVKHLGFDKLKRLSKKVDYQKFIVPGIVLLIGFARVLQGMSNNKPVNLLVFEIGLFSLISLMIAQQYSYTVLVFAIAKKMWRKQNADGYGNNILNNFSILGAAAIAGFAEYGVLANTFNFYSPPNINSSGDTSSGCGSGSSCSGGGSCGGGCGGCGGGD